LVVIEELLWQNQAILQYVDAFPWFEDERAYMVVKQGRETKSYEEIDKREGIKRLDY
jgi:hypothetical protein